VAQYLIRRSLQSLLLLIGVTVMTFTIMQIAPGGPDAFNEDPRLSPEYRQQVREEFGLDDPLPIQYIKWFSNILQGDMGRSFTDRRPVLDKILERAPATMTLNGAALVVGLLGIPIGVFLALNRNGFLDHFWRIFTVLGNAVPNWWLGLMILLISVKTVNWFPLHGMQSPGDGGIVDRLHHLLLPAVVLGTDGWLGYSRYMRAEMLDVISQDYIRTARAKGLAENVVLFRHALRNALIVVVTTLGGLLAGLLGGSILVEYVFSWPGMGRLAYESALQRDYAVSMGLVVIGSTLIVIGYLIADVAYAIVDPRIRFK
jgi:peptide/nickel transport system permease protein